MHTKQITEFILDTMYQIISAKKLLAAGFTKEQIEAAYDEGTIYYNMYEFSQKGLERQGIDTSGLLILDNGQVVATVTVR